MDKRRRDTKERIILAAIDLFAELGFDAVSIRRIARTVGITPASFYNHFTGKDQLLEAMYQYYAREIIQPAAAGVDLEGMLESMGVVEFLTKLIEIMFETEHDPQLFKLSRIIAMEQYKNHTAAEIAYTSREQSRKLLGDLFTSMAARGMIHTASPRQAAEVMGYMLSGAAADYFYLRYVCNHDPLELMQQQKQLVTRFCRDYLLEKGPGDVKP